MTTTNNDFLPEGYSVPQGASNYMKFQEGENKFRILSKPVIGWEYFDNDNKPVRHEGASQPIVDKSLIKMDKYGKQGLKHFWAVTIYSYSAKEIQILEITQTSIMNRIKELSTSADWGSVFQYDLTVTKKGSGKETEYSVTPTPPKPVSDEVKLAYKAKPCNLKALFTGGDPFAKDGAPATAKAAEQPKPVAQPASLVVDQDQLPF